MDFSKEESPSTPCAFRLWVVMVVMLRVVSPFRSTVTEACASPLWKRIGMLGVMVGGLALSNGHTLSNGSG